MGLPERILTPSFTVLIKGFVQKRKAGLSICGFF